MRRVQFIIRRFVSLIRDHPFITVLCVLVLAGAFWFGSKRALGTAVVVESPKRGEMVQSVVTTGRVRPLRVRLAPVVSGVVRDVFVKEGARVVAGQVLLSLENAEASASLANANAALKRVTASRRKLRTISKSSADEAVTQARARLKDAERDLARIRELLRADSVSRETAEQAETNAELARSTLRTAESQQRDLARGGATVISVDAELEQAKANVALAEARLGYTKVVAPAAGIVIARNVERGDALTANTIVLELAAVARTELVAEPDERNLALLALGQPAVASAEAFPDMRFAAEVSFVAPVVDSRRGTVEVRLMVPDPPDYLRPDMTVSVDIEVARKANALVVPIGAVSSLASDPFVLVVDNKRAVRRAVVVGIRDAKRVEIISGLDGMEDVILDPAATEVGARVRARSKP